MIMRQFIRLFMISLSLSGVLLLTACSSSGGGYRSDHGGVYSDYRYPYYGHGYGGCCYDNDDAEDYLEARDDRRQAGRERRQERRENRPDRPGGGMTRPGGGMGRPAGMSRGGGGRGRR